ncbi:MAG: DUF6493 family protein, partial [Rhodospirillales bacterium]|nr:DUF6493 family protein [Rhodospirillales bacterium]
MTAEKLEEIIRSGRAEKSAGFFAGMPEAERRELAPTARDRLVAAWKQQLDDLPSSARTKRGDPVDAARVAVLATASFGELKRLGWRAAPRHDESCWKAIRERRPQWLSEWCGWLLDESHWQWRHVRDLVREGVCAPPESDGYVLGMIEGLTGFRKTGGIAEALMADRELVQTHLWRLFELEGGGELSLAAHDKYTTEERGWAQALRSLSDQGEVSRDRLLSASLEALCRDFAQFRAGWFSRFHESLEPSVEERIALGAKYLDLLRSPIGPTVSFALRALKALHKAKRLDGRAFVEQVEPVLYAKSKNTVKTALKLMLEIAKADPPLQGKVARAAAIGLEHPELEVQETAIGLIERYGDLDDAELRTAIEQRIDLVSASLRSRAAAWRKADSAEPLGDSEDGGADLSGLLERARSLPADLAALAGVDIALAELDGLKGVVRSARFSGMEIPRLAPDMALRPVETVEELVDCFLEAIEQPEDVDRVELVIDGLARLGGRRPETFARLTGPLAKRIGQLKKRREVFEWTWGEPLQVLFILADAWLHDTVFEIGWEKSGEPYFDYQSYSDWEASGGSWKRKRERCRLYVDALGVTGVFLLRAVVVAKALATGQTMRLLSAPTHRGGWILPSALIERTQQYRALDLEMDTADQVLALLRLAPDGREQALGEARSLDGEWSAALRYALGSDQEAIGDTAPLWVAAARARAPFSDDEAIEKKFPKLGPDAGAAARLAYTVVVDKHPEVTFYWFKVKCEPEAPGPYQGEGSLIWRGLPAFASVSRQTRSASFLPTVLLHRLPERLYFDDPALAFSVSSPWGPTLWPANPEPIFAAGAFDAASYDYEARPSAVPPPCGYRLMLDPDRPITPMGRVMLCLGLNARDAAEGQMATDALIAVLEDGRLDGRTLGEAMRGLLFTGIVKPKRWLRRLGEAARVSPLHA